MKLRDKSWKISFWHSLDALSQKYLILYFLSFCSFLLSYFLVYYSQNLKLNFAFIWPNNIIPIAKRFISVYSSIFKTFTTIDFVDIGFFHATRPYRPASCNRRRTVDSEMTILRLFPSSALIAAAGSRRLAFILRWIRRSVCVFVFRFRSQPIMFPIHFVDLYFNWKTSIQNVEIFEICKIELKVLQRFRIHWTIGKILN